MRTSHPLMLRSARRARLEARSTQDRFAARPAAAPPWQAGRHRLSRWGPVAEPRGAVPVTQPTRYELAAWILAGLALVGVLHLGLLAALLAGLLVFELVDIAAAKLATLGVSRVNAKIAALAVVAVVTITAVTLSVLGLF